MSRSVSPVVGNVDGLSEPGLVNGGGAPDEGGAMDGGGARDGDRAPDGGGPVDGGRAVNGGGAMDGGAFRATEGNLSADAAAAEPNSKSICDLLKTREWLQTQLIEYQTEVKVAEQHNTWTMSDDPEKIVEGMAELQTDLQGASTDLALRQIMLSRVQQGKTLVQHLFPTSQGGGDNVDSSGERKKQQKRLLTDLVSKQTALTSQILKIHAENQEKVKEVEQLQKANLALKQSVRELMNNLQKVKDTEKSSQHDDAQNQALRMAQDKLKYSTEKTELIRHIFQGLILGSGVNWAQDPELTELLLGLGKPLDTQM